MSHFRHYGKNYSLTSAEDAASIVERLPGGIFTLKSGIFGYYLEEEPLFKLPPKLYGSTKMQADRIWNTFNKRPGSTGALFSGLKGSGKTLLMKVLANRAAGIGVPTIIINEPHRGIQFNQFIQGIEQDAIIVFDEFEKVYQKESNDTNENPQDGLLSLLDGIYSNSKKLFLFTSNSTFNLSSFLKNRPSRVWYHFKFEGLESDFVREYAEDKLDNKSRVGAVVSFARVVGQFNFDLLQALVEEMNLYDESVADASRYLNIDVEDSKIVYEIGSVTHEKFQFKVESPDVTFNVNLAKPFFHFTMFITEKKVRGKKATPGFENYIVFTQDDVVDVGMGGETMMLKNAAGFTLNLKREVFKASVDMKKKFFEAETGDLV